MKCKEIKNKLSMFIDNEINDKERKIVEAHLLLCSACQKELKRLESVNLIGKEAIFVEPEPEYWQDLTVNIMDRIRPAEEKQPIWPKVVDKLGNIILPERINYRFVGLAAATVILIFFVKISFFDKGKFNLPMDMDEIESIINEPQVEENTEQLIEFEEEVKVPEEDMIASKTTAAKSGDKKGGGRKTLIIVDGVRLGSRAKEKSKQTILPKSGRGAAPLNSDTKLKQLPERIEKEVAKDKAEMVDEREVSSLNLADKDKSFSFERAVQNKPMETKFQKQAELKKLGASKTRQKEALPMEMEIQAPSVPVDSKLYAPAGKRIKTRSFEYQPIAIQATPSKTKENHFINLINTINTKKAEEKLELLKAYLFQFPDSNFKEQATFLLAENLVELANEKNTESTLKEAIEFFHKHKNEMKEFENYKKLKTEITELENKLKK